jgi:hypothetical protein
VAARAPFRRFGQNVHGVERLDFAAFGDGKHDHFLPDFN